MKRIYKISIFLSLFCLALAIGSLAMAGKGYFLEKDNKLYIFDDVNLNGYLSVESSLTSNTGLQGDVLVEKLLNFDENKTLYFCKNITGNENCSKLIMSWTPLALTNVDNDFYKIQVNKIMVAEGGTITLEQPTQIKIDNAVKIINGCFSNDGSNICTPDADGELKTAKLYLDRLAGFPNTNKITLDPAVLNLTGGINLGSDANLENQNFCWKVEPSAVCDIPGARKGEDWYTHKNYDINGIQIPVAYGSIDGGTGLKGADLCCFLNVSFPITP